MASARDMLNFFNALRRGVLISPDMLALATVPGDTPWYGLGFVTQREPVRSWGHGGGSYGMSVAAHRYPDRSTTFICLATRDYACDRMIFAWYFRTFGLEQ